VVIGTDCIVVNPTTIRSRPRWPLIHLITKIMILQKYIYQNIFQEKFEDKKGMIRSRKLKDRQDNGQKKKD